MTMNTLDNNSLSVIFSYLNYLDASNFRVLNKKINRMSALHLSIRRWRNNNIKVKWYYRLNRYGYDTTHSVVIEAYIKAKYIRATGKTFTFNIYNDFNYEIKDILNSLTYENYVDTINKNLGIFTEKVYISIYHFGKKVNEYTLCLKN